MQTFLFLLSSNGSVFGKPKCPCPALFLQSVDESICELSSCIYVLKWILWYYAVLALKANLSGLISSLTYEKMFLNRQVFFLFCFPTSDSHYLDHSLYQFSLGSVCVHRFKQSFYEYQSKRFPNCDKLYKRIVITTGNLDVFSVWS